MRAFIGLPFSLEVRKYLEDIKNLILKDSISSNPSLMANFHLTLLFIGEVDISNQKKIESAMESLANNTSFYFELSQLGKFERKKESILWVGVNEGLKSLELLQKQVINLVNGIGFDFPLAFTPHITLARRVVFKENVNLQTIMPYSKPVLVNEVVLYESHSVNGVLTYTPRKIVKLKEINKGE